MSETSTIETPAASRPGRKERVGTVVSNKMQKTLVVETTTRVPHPKFGKIVKHVKKFYAHDEEGKAKNGDVVRIVECRPLSKLKRWELKEIVREAVQVTTDLSSIGIAAARETRVSKKQGKK